MKLEIGMLDILNDMKILVEQLDADFQELKDKLGVD